MLAVSAVARQVGVERGFTFLSGRVQRPRRRTATIGSVEAFAMIST
jgi:hypothetical protein